MNCNLFREFFFQPDLRYFILLEAGNCNLGLQEAVTHFLLAEIVQQIR
jgi:hypothetical protein